MDLAWEVIESDPLLRMELAAIEQHSADDQMVNELVEFFARVEAMVRLTSVILEDSI